MRNLVKFEYGLTGVLVTTLPPLGPTRTPRWCRIDPELGAATTRAPAASREDSRSQAILKLHHPSNLDYRARHKILVRVGLCGSEGNIYICNLIFFQWFISENCEE